MILLNAGFPSEGNNTRGHTIIIEDGIIKSLDSCDSGDQSRHAEKRVIDCRNKTVIPGLIDAHCHIVGMAKRMVTLNLGCNSIKSIGDICHAIQTSAAGRPSNDWIRGNNYNEFNLKEKRHLNRWDLDQAAPNHPVKITHRSGHAHVLNSMALERVGITEKTPEPPGGIIDRDISTGQPTGLLFEMGKFLSEQIPPLTEAELNKGVAKANRYLLSRGITTIQDATAFNGFKQWKRLDRWKQEQLIQPRINMMLGAENWQETIKKIGRFRSYRSEVKTNCVKIVLDETTGHLNPDPKSLERIVMQIHRAGFQVAIHAIEATAVLAASTAIETALREQPADDHRHRIEHCSICPQSLASRLGSIGIHVVTQPAFLYFNGDRYRKTVPAKQQKDLYAIGSLIKNGVAVAGSSDSPVVPADPFSGIQAAVNRRSQTGTVLNDQEAVSPVTALSLYTQEAAKVMFEENRLGALAPGMAADLVVLDKDPLQGNAETLVEINPLMTIINGKVAWGMIN